MNYTKRKNNSLLILASLMSVLIGQSCKRDLCETEIAYYKYTPVYESLEDFRAPGRIKATPARKLESPGKIYYSGNYIFVNELYKGVHVIDNNNPANPSNIAFIEIPGNMDIAVQGNVLYADAMMDLISIDISSPVSPTLLSRVEDALPQPTYVNNVYLEPEKGVVTNWEVEKITQKGYINCSGNAVSAQEEEAITEPGSGLIKEATVLANTAQSGSAPSVSANNPNLNGLGGSMARFTIAANHLFIVTDNKMHIYNLTSPQTPTKMNELWIGTGVETIYPYKEKLFIGMSTGMQIYDNSNPASPEFLSIFEHARGCDPVVVQEDYAYVTLRSGGPCGPAADELHVVDLSTITMPVLVASYEMEEPFGVGVDGDKVFVCDGNAGLKLFDATEASTLKLIDQNSNLNAYDVIPNQGILMMVGQDGLYQFGYQGQSLNYLSHIPVEK